EAYRVASTKSFWRYRDAPTDRQADLRSHNFEWEHGDAKLAVRYIAQENLFLSNPFNSDAIEVAGGTTLMQTRRSDRRQHSRDAGERAQQRRTHAAHRRRHRKRIIQCRSRIHSS